MTNIKKILAPIDFSAYSRHAFEIAWSLARDYGGSLVLLHVVPPPLITPESGYVLSTLDDTDEALKKLRQMQCAGPAVPVECVGRVGDAATEILDLARAAHCDLIVIGTHGRTGLRRLLMGSVAEQILRNAPCPVLTVRGTAEAPAASTEGKALAAAK
jgi:nucleotide-binding universal stress UspA family protein